MIRWLTVLDGALKLVYVANTMVIARGKTMPTTVELYRTYKQVGDALPQWKPFVIPAYSVFCRRTSCMP